MNSQPGNYDGGFCVLMAVYKKDDPELFARALASIRDNSLAPNQVVIVADGPLSTELEDVLMPYHGEWEVLRLPHNVGLARALNAGIARVKSTWVVRADADDINLPDRFCKLAQASRSSGLAPDVMGSAILEMDRQGRPIAVRRPPLSHQQILEALPLRSPMNHMAVAYRAEAVRAVGGYPDVHLKEDYALWCLLARQGCSFLNLPEVLVHATAGMEMYRRRGGWKYIRSEIQLQRLMVKWALKGPAAALKHGLMRSVFFALPSRCRGLIYARMLRTPPEK